MSFGESFEGREDFIIHHNANRQLGLMEFVQLMKERATIEEFYGKELEKLQTHSYKVSEYGAVQIVAKAFKKDCGNRAESSQALASSINKDIIDPLSELIKAQSQEGKLIELEVKGLKKELKTFEVKLNKQAGIYQNACMDMEGKVKKMERKSSLPKEQLVKGTTSNQEEVRNAINVYKSAINEIATYKVTYDEKVSEILNKYQSMEILRINEFKRSIEKLIELQNTKQDNFSSIELDLSSIDAEHDIDVFITKHTDTVDSYDNPYKFVPYYGTHAFFKNLQDNCPFDEPEQLLSEAEQQEMEQEQKMKFPMENILNQAWSGFNLAGSDVELFKEMAKEPAGRRVWSSCMNQFRLNGTFIMED